MTTKMKLEQEAEYAFLGGECTAISTDSPFGKVRRAHVSTTKGVVLGDHIPARVCELCQCLFVPSEKTLIDELDIPGYVVRKPLL
jgi:hypothetical protein